MDHIFIPSFRSLLGPLFGVQIWTQKWGQPSGKFLLLPADVLQADLRRLYGRRVSTSFLDPVFGAMMKQACRQTLKSLAAECLVGVRLGLLNFLTPVCVD